MSDSILTDTKKVLGIAEDDTSFDLDVIMHINSAFTTLADLGVGPATGFMITDATTTWGALLGSDLNLNNVKTLVYLKVRLVFDPPNTSFVLNALQEQIREHEWRLNTRREATDWVDPEPLVEPAETIWGDPIVIDGGVG
jgi:hypothetical protein